jgi:allantoin racemase
MVRLLYLMPGIEVGQAEMRRREKIAAQFLTDPSNKIVVEECDEGPVAIESVTENEMSVPGLIKKALKLKGTYDALIVGCAGDPGLYALREVLDVPVVGPLESSLAVASMLGYKYSVATILETGIPKVWSTLRKYGEDHRCASVRAIQAKVQEMVDGDVSRDSVIRSVETVADMAMTDGASCVILGCMTMAFLLVDESTTSPLPIVNPAKVSVKIAEMLATLGIRHSDISYPKPDIEKLQRTILRGLL